MSTDPFEFVDAASYTKEDLIDQGASEGDYSAYLTNRALSYHSDSVLYANEMNFYRNLPGRLQFDYLRHSLRRKRRRSKWHRPEDAGRVRAVSWKMGLSVQKARQALSVMTVDDVDKILKDYKESTSDE